MYSKSQILKTRLAIIVLAILIYVIFRTPLAFSADLHSLVQSGNYLAIKNELAKKRAKIEARNKNGDTLILIAARRGDLKMVKLLVNHGANINALDTKRRDILNIAITTRNPLLARLALDLGADPTMVTSIYNGSALIYGSAKGAVKIVEMLINAGAPVNRVNNLGWTALLEIVILGNDSEPYIAITKMLLKAGAKKSIADKKGMTPLEHAKKREYKNLVKVLSQ